MKRLAEARREHNKGAEFAAMRPFRLVKFFSFTSLVVFLVFTLALSWLISNYAKQVLLERSEAYALVVTENLSHQVFQQFVIPTVLKYGSIALRNSEQHKLLDTVVRNATHGMHIESVTIYDSRDNIISYSTIEDKIGQRDVGGEEYRRALEGENVSRLVSEGSWWGLLPGVAPGSSRLRTYIPFIQYTPLADKPDTIMGVIEVKQDLSDDMEAIARFQLAVVLISILMMSALFVVLRTIVGRAEGIMEKRAEERRRLEQQLHQHEKLATLGKMVASVSHEIKNPLGIIRSTAAMLGKRLRQTAPGNERLTAIIVEETSRLDGIVREFLDFARPQSPNFTTNSLAEVVEQALAFVTPELEKSGVETVLELDREMAPFAFDREQIYRALLNILFNAAQAMPEGGKLRVRSQGVLKDGVAVALLEITDSGIGIEPAQRERIFTPFYTGKHRGTGLGLAIVKNIIDNHQGGIEVASRPGQGTTFRIILPLQPDAPFASPPVLSALRDL
ncbi:MAG: ATP-binding protein [Desulfurivibrio sp.]|nr:ATP-binding protein [Desulfurivibrio sp.]